MKFQKIRKFRSPVILISFWWGVFFSLLDLRVPGLLYAHPEITEVPEGLQNRGSSAPFLRVVSIRQSLGTHFLSLAGETQAFLKDRLKVPLFLELTDGPFVKKNQMVEVTLAQDPDSKIKGQISQAQEKLDPSVRRQRLSLEIEIPLPADAIPDESIGKRPNQTNQKWVIGQKVNVIIEIPSLPYLQIPVEALVTKNRIPSISILSLDHRVRYRPVHIVQQDEKYLWVSPSSTGVKQGDLAILNPGDALPEGSSVRPVMESPVF